MEIIGYSERGAMNALFYEMSFKDEKVAEEHMQKFLSLAHLDQYSNLNVYLEFSLSEFGSPDLVIIAEEPCKTVFFIEAKVSESKVFKMDSVLSEYEKENPDTSNLLYQLKQKEAFFEVRNVFPNRTDICEERIATSMGPKTVGNRPVVRRFVDILKQCADAKYLAIVPDFRDERCDWEKRNPISDLKIVYWEDIYQTFGKELGYKSLKKTIEFNQGKDPTIKSKVRIVSQILNKPIPDIE